MCTLGHWYGYHVLLHLFSTSTSEFAKLHRVSKVTLQIPQTWTQNSYEPKTIMTKLQIYNDWAVATQYGNKTSTFQEYKIYVKFRVPTDNT